MNRERTSRWSFTLIEMLVVIVIIGILAALIMPSLGTSRENARCARCKNHLKTLHTATMSYASENDAWLPNSRSTEYYETLSGSNRWIKNRTGWLDWTDYVPNHDAGNANAPRPGYTRWWGPSGVVSIVTGRLWDYTGKNMKTYLCPTFARGEYCSDRDPRGTAFSAANAVVRSYGMNDRILDWKLGLRPLANWTWVPVESSRTMLFADLSHTNRIGGTQMSVRSLRSYFNNQVQDSDAWDGAFSGGTNNVGMLYEVLGSSHNGKANVVFLDGHVETLAATWTNTYLPWNSTW
jgi:prepilin-type processing-associated H-X9-DG protein/prepilin-type N-terminal cleavage/methylation domain-containing protein